MGTEIEVTKAQRSAVQELLLANARKSLVELAEITGLTPEDAAERLSALLEDRGWFTERQDERLLLIELDNLISTSRDRLANAEDKDYAGIAKIILGAMQQMADRWDARKRLVDDDISKITQANARTFSRVFDIALVHVRSGIKNIYPDLDDEIMDALVAEGLTRAKKQLEAEVKQ